MKKNPILCDKKPKGCKCHYTLWVGWYEVCENYVKAKSHFDGRCENCEHNENCHKNKFRKNTKKISSRTVVSQ